VTVEVIIQISKQFATPFGAFFAKLGKSPKKVVEIATSLGFGYPMGVSGVAAVGISSRSPEFFGVRQDLELVNPK
jgi:hypothetical protein